LCWHCGSAKTKCAVCEVGFPADKLAIGLALIFAVDRPLDMCRTMVNVTGDATVSMIIVKFEDKLHKPKSKEWDDNLDKVI
jgi:Na+/H+-dicarboxylate symporter